MMSSDVCCLFLCLCLSVFDMQKTSIKRIKKKKKKVHQHALINQMLYQLNK